MNLLYSRWLTQLQTKPLTSTQHNILVPQLPPPLTQIRLGSLFRTPAQWSPRFMAFDSARNALKPVCVTAMLAAAATCCCASAAWPWSKGVGTTTPASPPPKRLPVVLVVVVVVPAVIVLGPDLHLVRGSGDENERKTRWRRCPPL